MTNKSNENTAFASEAGDKLLTFDKPLVMGIINLTPDSFYDGGRYGNRKAVLQDVEEKIRQGADVLDLGAASSRPGAAELSEEEEWKRLEPALLEIRNHFPEAFISIDTVRAGIAEKSAGAGANMINDTSGGNADAEMFKTIARLQLPYVLMHMQGSPQTMQVKPEYKNVVRDVYSFFEQKTQALKQLGFTKLIIDPGFGFGKTPEHNFLLLKHLREFSSLGYPVLAGLSRKSMINAILDTNPVTALNGTTVLNSIALINGASMLRVHDVQEAKQAIDLVSYYQKL
jgi:dihydropteroate synthase